MPPPRGAKWRTSCAILRLVARLDSWKEIASHLGRGIRTVQRWEREEGLPVHRLDHVKRGTVYADPKELDAWWESRRRAEAPADAAADRRTTSRLERVTNTSAATFWPTLSSDGRMVAYVSDAGQDGERPQIWLQQIGGAALRLTTGVRECADPSFSPDDTRILFTARGQAGLNLYEIPALGGTPRLVKRAAGSGRLSPDGRRLAYVALEPPYGLRVADADGTQDRHVAPGLLDVSTPIWLPASKHVLVRAHPDVSIEPDYWVVPLDGGPPVNTGVLQMARRHALWLLSSAPVWTDKGVVFSATGRDDVKVYRQPLDPATYQAQGAPEALTSGSAAGWFPAGAPGRLAFVSGHPDINLWSVAIDADRGQPYGPLRRLTRGPGILGHLSLTADGRTLAYFTSRSIPSTVVLRNLEDGTETIVAAEPQNDGPGFPAISPSGRQLAFGIRTTGPAAARPVFITSLPDGGSRELAGDGGGRPRLWLDERYLLIETFGSRLKTFVVIDTTDGSRHELLGSASRSLSNPRISPGGRTLAFDATRTGGAPSVMIAPLRLDPPVPESDWALIEESASHPFWSRDGRLLYYLATTPNAETRGAVRARRITPDSSAPEAEPFEVLALGEMLVPALISGMSPIAAPDQIVMVLGDFRGDIWMMDV
jgi:Tol biopolymer transport system component